MDCWMWLEVVQACARRNRAQASRPRPVVARRWMPVTASDAIRTTPTNMLADHCGAFARARPTPGPWAMMGGGPTAEKSAVLPPAIVIGNANDRSNVRVVSGMTIDRA